MLGLVALISNNSTEEYSRRFSRGKGCGLKKSGEHSQKWKAPTKERKKERKKERITGTG
jgi:hypothetical protein